MVTPTPEVRADNHGPEVRAGCHSPPGPEVRAGCHGPEVRAGCHGPVLAATARRCRGRPHPRRPRNKPRHHGSADRAMPAATDDGDRSSAPCPDGSPSLRRRAPAVMGRPPPRRRALTPWTRYDATPLARRDAFGIRGCVGRPEARLGRPASGRRCLPRTTAVATPTPDDACRARRFAHRRHQAGAGGPGRGLDTNPRFGSDPASTPPGPLQRSVAVGRTGPPRAAAPGTARGVDCWLCLAPRRRAVATAYHRPRRVPGVRIAWVVRFSQELTPREWFRRLSCVARVLCARLAAVQGLLQTSWPGHRMRLLFLPLTRRNGCWRSRTGPKAVHDTQ